MRKLIFSLVCMLLVATYSCKKDTVSSAPDQGYSYYPAKLKSYIIYDVDSIVYDDFKKDTTEYKSQIKEVMDSVFTDNQGRSSMKIIRYVKPYNDTIPYAQMSWKVKDVWYATKTSSNVEVIEENIRFLKLYFPVKKNTAWNGNVYNTMGDWQYTYSEVDVALTLNSNYFDSTATVLQKDYTDLIDRKYYVEKYAKNVGLVYREIIDVHSNTIKSGVPTVNRIDRGIKFKQTVVSYGY